MRYLNYLLVLVFFTLRPAYAFLFFSSNEDKKGTEAIVKKIYDDQGRIIQEDSQLGFVPYSSSYLPKYKGELINPESVLPISPEISKLINKSVLKDGPKTVLARFDASRKKIIDPNREELTPILKAKLYDPKAPTWVGLCHQWSPAALNEEINTLISSIDGIICGEIFLSKGETKELFTGLFEDTRTEEQSYGARHYFNPDSKLRIIGNNTDSMKAVLASLEIIHKRLGDTLGIDDFPAHVLHKQLHSNLQKNRGIILDIDSTYEVWNFPIYSTNSKYTYLGSTDQKTLSKYATVAPSYVWTSESSDEQKYLTLLKKIDDALHAGKLLIDKSISKEEKKVYELSTYFSGELDSYLDEHIAELNELLKMKIELKTDDSPLEDTEREDLELSKKEDENLYKLEILQEMRTAFLEKFISPAIGNGKITLKDGIKLTDVESVLTFSTEVDFSVPENKKQTRTYEYLLIDNNGTADSVWMIPTSDRPDFLWVNRPSLPSKKLNRSIEALFDLIDLLKRCTNVREIVNFFGDIEEVVSANNIRPEDKTNLINKYSKLKPYVNHDLLKELLDKSTLLSIDDFDKATQSTVTSGPSWEVMMGVKSSNDN